MGYSSYTIAIANPSPLKPLQDFIFTNLVRLINFHKKYTLSTSDDDDDDDDPNYTEFHPSPLSVPLPVHLMNNSHKDHLPIVQYMMITPRLQVQHDEEEEEEEEEEADSCCAVCLRGIEAWHKVRKLGNCEHAFHVECLDSWIDYGRETCPVCRAKLLPAGYGEELRPGKDPWRSERMVYLFGQDLVMEELE